MDSYLIFSGILMLIGLVAAFLYYHDDEDLSRKAALLAITCWAWPLWLIIGIWRLTQYALEPYLKHLTGRNSN